MSKSVPSPWYLSAASSGLADGVFRQLFVQCSPNPAQPSLAKPCPSTYSAQLKQPLLIQALPKSVNHAQACSVLCTRVQPCQAQPALPSQSSLARPNLAQPSPSPVQSQSKPAQLIPAKPIVHFSIQPCSAYLFHPAQCPAYHSPPQLSSDQPSPFQLILEKLSLSLHFICGSDWQYCLFQ